MTRDAQRARVEAAVSGPEPLSRARRDEVATILRRVWGRRRPWWRGVAWWLGLLS